MKESERLSEVLQYFRNVQNTYDFTAGRISDLECLQNDYLHKLEFNATEVKERNKIATGLRKCRIERRQMKEQEEILRELNDFIYNNSDKIRYFERILGNMRKIESTQVNRSYKPRMMSIEEYKGV